MDQSKALEMTIPAAATDAIFTNSRLVSLANVAFYNKQDFGYSYTLKCLGALS